MIGILVFVSLVLGIILFNRREKRIASEYHLPQGTSNLLEQNVAFYQRLDAPSRTTFEARVKDFLANTTVRGVGTEITDLDMLLVAAGAIIPIFAFPDWRYNNISEVLIYADAFSKDFKTTGDGRNVAGMVGDGAMHRQMILSKQALRASFSNELDGNNTVIHEFVHLIDKADGSVDGIPEYLLSHPCIIPWVKLMRDKISEMRANGSGDINFYGATNDAEFFAVVAEYFFERPEKLKANHPKLYDMLEQMFSTKTKK